MTRQTWGYEAARDLPFFRGAAYVCLVGRTLLKTIQLTSRIWTEFIGDHVGIELPAGERLV
jgi:hypothetical protein